MAKNKKDEVEVIKEGGRLEKSLVAILDNASRLQGPAVEKYVAYMRRAHPNDTPAQLIERLENRFILAVTGSGSAVGGAAAIPGLGTVASLAAVGADKRLPVFVHCWVEYVLQSLLPIVYENARLQIPHR